MVLACLLMETIGRRYSQMLWTVVLILVILWALGAFVVPLGGGLIHLLLVIALIVLLVQLISGRRVAL
jgi:Family of unknown function (DUF5670)